MENNADKKGEEKDDNSTSFLPSKPLNDSVVKNDNESESYNKPNTDSISQGNIASTTTSMPSSTTSSTTMPSSTTPAPLMPLSTLPLMEEDDDNMMDSEQSVMSTISLPGSSGLQNMLTSTGDLVSGECYRYLGNVKNIDGQLAPIFSEDCGAKGGRSGVRSRKRRRRRRRNGGATEKIMVEGGRHRSKRVNKSQYRKRRSYRGGEFPSAMSPLMAYNVPV